MAGRKSDQLIVLGGRESLLQGEAVGRRGIFSGKHNLHSKGDHGTFIQRKISPVMITGLERIAVKCLVKLCLSEKSVNRNSAANPLLKSVVREIRTLRSVGIGTAITRQFLLPGLRLESS